MLLSGACMHLPEGSVDPGNPTSWSWNPLALHSRCYSLPWTVALRGGAAVSVGGPVLDLHSACLPPRLATLNANLPEHAWSEVPVPPDCSWAIASCSCGLQLGSAAAQHRNCAVSAAYTKRKAAMHTQSPALLHANRGCSGTPAADSKQCSRLPCGESDISCLAPLNVKVPDI